MPENEAEPGVFVPLAWVKVASARWGETESAMEQNSLKPGYSCRVGRKQQEKALPST